jgi:predicted MFS family arabinose efflux permease
MPSPSRRLLLVMALACAVGVSTVYFPQALTPLLARDLHTSLGAAALVATLAQAGYAAGIFLLVPLGDRVPRRPLVAVLLGVVAIALLLAATAPALPPLYLLSTLAGAATVVPQILIPMAADLAAPDRAGRVVAVLQGGLLAGVLLARAFGGALGQWLGWRAAYLIAAVLAATLALTLLAILPPTTTHTRQRYLTLLATTLRLFREQPDLRRSCLYQFLLFGAFSAAWTSLALLLTGPAYRYGTSIVAVLALVGAASVLAVPYTGRRIDRRGPDPVSLACFGLLAIAGVVLLGGLLRGTAGIVALVVGMLLLDVAVQASQVANQARVFALVPGARSRLNSAYMTAVFLGGSTGSWIGTRAYLAFGWAAVCALLLLAAAGALLRHLGRRPVPRFTMLPPPMGRRVTSSHVHGEMRSPED